MSEEHTKKLSQHNVSPVHFDDRTALHLTQAFAQEKSLKSLLDLLFSQLTTLTGARGLQYSNRQLGMDLKLGRESIYTAQYNLSIDDKNLGKLTLQFPRTQHEAEIQTCEDLVSLAFTALNHQVELLALQHSEAKSVALGKEEKADALVLVALDGYAEMRSRDGDEWSQILMSSVHTQIKEGLRQADGVYQISDELIAVLLPHTTREQAHEVAEKIRVLVASLHLSGGDDNMVDQQLTATMGISDAKLASTAEEVMENAKTALAFARDHGRNTIQIYDEALLTKLGIG